MKIKNLKINKKKLSSILLAFNLLFCSTPGKANVKSYENETTLIDGTKVILHYITDNGNDSLAVVTLGNQVIYAAPSCVNYYNLDTNNIYQEETGLVEAINDCYMYSMPEENNNYIVQKVNTGMVFDVMAKSSFGWYNVSINGSVIGFIHEKNLKPKEEKIAIVRIKGNSVNIRKGPGTDTAVIGSCNTNDYFEFIEECGDWYKIRYQDSYAYVSKKYSQREFIEKNKSEKVLAAKITGNNVNVRSGPDTSFTMIGFADSTDYFEIIDMDNDWYHVKYLNQDGYIYKDYVKEEMIDTRMITYQKVVYLTKESAFYQDLNGNIYTYLPEYQSAQVIDEINGYYQVNIEGVIGYIQKNDAEDLSRNCVVVDLSRQILKVYSNGREVYRAKIISGREDSQTNIGCFKIGHHITDHVFEKSGIFNEYWMQFDGNIGLHPADANNGKGWQLNEYFENVVEKAYNNWAKGNGKTYPASHGSSGCVNMHIKDIEIVYQLVNAGDNVLVIGPNNLKRLHISNNINNYSVNAYKDYNNMFFSIDKFFGQENDLKTKKLV